VVGALAAALAWLPAVFLLMPLWLFARMALNAIDGMLAREHGQKSVLGAYLNELGDVVSDLALILPFARAMPSASGEVILFAILAVLVECAGLIGPLAGAGRRYDGPLGKSDRALALGALGLGIGLGFGLGRYGRLVWVLLSLLSVLTIVNRVRCGVKEAEQANAARAGHPFQPGEYVTERSWVESHFDTHDGQSLFYRHWPAAGLAPEGAVLLFHRGHEHSGRVAHLVDELNLPDHAFFAWDARGHGRSPGERGSSPSLATSVRDIQTFVDHIAATHGIPVERMAVVAQSVGAVLATTWVHDYAPRIRCLVVASPAFKVKLYVPFARPGLRLMHRLRGKFFVNSYVKAKFLTHDAQRISSFQQDPLITRPIAVNILLDLHDTADRIVADGAAITVPAQLLISGADWVVHRGPQDKFFDRLGSRVKERIVLDGFYHDTLGERARATAVDAARRFIVREFDTPSEPVSLLRADREGVFREESDRLAVPPAPRSLADLYWRLTRAGLRLSGAFSEGVRLGHKTGFDSGSTLDYVYRNQPAGRFGIGRLIDRNYLDAIGWRGIRQRKLSVEELIGEAIRRLREAGEPVRIVDIAAGHGRYVLDAIAAQSGGVAAVGDILLRDYSDINVEQGCALILSRGMEHAARFEKGDAFDAESLAALDPAPTLAVVSGLYELFGDNDMVGRSLGGLGRAVRPGGYLVYTGQPWHPQLEFIARALTSHRAGTAWVMRRRSQAELDELVRNAGFEKISQRIDQWGIFTVSLARRVGRP
jgi:alpha-beta hydrolase superfamily lysophospholipase/phosphatidylglycerophosphate synthase